MVGETEHLDQHIDNTLGQAVVIAQVLERMNSLKQNIEDVSKAVQDHRIEHKNDNIDLKNLITSAMDKLDAKVEKVKEDHDGKIDKHGKSIEVLKRDHKWAAAIFMAIWAGVVAWVKVSFSATK